jgi:hypothetical protein
MKNKDYILAALFTLCFIVCGAQEMNVTISSNFILEEGKF